MPSAKPKKFGAFAGVFTPSILTSLGVIMYMRLGWVVGQAGLLAALWIILLAHLISVSTGLSISSIATDKKIKSGGIYYILSRSLGLPIGGSTGITIFVGASFSIALYIIGFCENFLGIEAISNFLDMEPTTQNFRIVGSIVLIMLTVIAFISTSIAIKTQFFILGAIVLSIASIVTGFFTGDKFSSEEILWLPAAGGVSTITIFAIFFPAVKGFNAGVAMSGDLKNPKKDIPRGTMASIIVGLIVYIGLATGFSIGFEREMLMEDTNFLMKVAWSGPLVVAGIWGATLSSALAVILGAPRILQAISKDKITPKVLGRGFGVNNEPRNALIFTFILAESGILIGQLDMIAAIVTMFYIAAYGFINLAFALEKWASTDFRPSFKISHWVGVAGFIACFAVMFKIDTLAMFGSLLILGGIYTYIKRKKIALAYGDVWQSVRTHLVRKTLNKIDKNRLEERNWRPNIILFSGGTMMRPHLLQFGKDLAGYHGLVSNFDLILNTSANVLFKKHQQSLDTDESRTYEGIFTRRHECKDIYEGIEAISSTYGFSGIEPNTVLFGWARQSENPVRFVRLIKTLSDLDLNLLMLDYDKEAGFGKRQRIDVWCRGGGNNCTLMMSLVKFLWISETWKNASARILIINPINDQKEKLIRDTERVLDDLRMNAGIKVLNNQIEQRPAYEIIQVESSNSDLVLLGIPEIREGEEHLYVENVNHLSNNIGTTLLVKASSFFKEIQIGMVKPSGIQLKSEFAGDGRESSVTREIRPPTITYPMNPILAEHVHILYDQIKRMDEWIYKNHLVELFSLHKHPIRDIQKITTGHLSKLKEYTNTGMKKSEWKQHLYNAQQDIIRESKSALEKLDDAIFSEQHEIIQKGISYFHEQILNISGNIPGRIARNLDKNDLRINKDDSFYLRLFKLKKQLVKRSTKPTYTIYYKKLVKAYFDNAIYQPVFEVMENYGMISLQYLIKVRKLNENAFNSYIKLDKLLQEHDIGNTDIDREIAGSDKIYNEFSVLNETSLQSIYILLLNKTFYVIQQISNDLKILNVNRHIKKRRKSNAIINRTKSGIEQIPGHWYRNQKLLGHMNIIEIELQKYVLDLRIKLDTIHNGMQEIIGKNILKNYHDLMQNLSDRKNKFPADMKKIRVYLDPGQFTYLCDEQIEQQLEALRTSNAILPQTAEVMEYDVYENFKEKQFSNHKPVKLQLSAFASYITEREFIDPVISGMKEMQIQLTQSMVTVQNLISRFTEAHATNENMPEYPSRKNEFMASLEKEISQVEKVRFKALNKIKERKNALSDNFSIAAILRKTNTHKKFISR